MGQVARRRERKQEPQKHRQHDGCSRYRQRRERSFEPAAFQNAHGPAPQRTQVEAMLVDGLGGDLPQEAFDVVDPLGRQVQVDVAGGPGQDHQHQDNDSADMQETVAWSRPVEAFDADHVVPALGYHLLRRKRRLAASLAGQSPRRVAELRRSGAEVEETVEEVWVSYCGDTGPQVFEREPRLLHAGVLLLECTFLDSQPRAKGDRFKHIHVQDLVERADRFQNRALVLHHLSRRHRLSELRALIEERLPNLAARIHLLGE